MVRTLDATASAAAGDYVPLHETVDFAAGQTSATVPVTVNGEVATHSYFGLQVIPPEVGVSVPDDYGRADLLRPTDSQHEFVYAGSVVAVQAAGVAESVLVPVTVSPAGHPDTVTCSFATSDEPRVWTAANGDYTPASGTVTVPPGVATPRGGGEHPASGPEPPGPQLPPHPERLLGGHDPRRGDERRHRRRQRALRLTAGRGRA